MILDLVAALVTAMSKPRASGDDPVASQAQTNDLR